MKSEQNHESEATVLEAAKPLHFAAALLLSLVIFNSGYVISQTLRWTDHLHGLFNGLIHSMFFSFGWAMFFLPWSLAVFYCFSKKADKARRNQWILAPAWLVLILMVGGIALDPPTVKKRFERMANVSFPSHVENLNTKFTGGGLMDYGDTYYFRTSSAEIQRIIREKQMLEDEFFGKHGMSSTMMKPLPGSPDFKSWEGAKQYQWFDSRNHWFAYLITDSSKTQAYIFVGCT